MMQQRLPYSDDLPDLFLFLSVLLAGIFILSVAKTVGISQIWITVALAMLMIGYSVAAGFVERFKLRTDQVGDNAYYLGFLYTLVSLAATLFSFAGTTDVVAEVVGGFGIALVTTIIGIALRVILHQMRNDPADVEEQSRLMIAKVSSELTAELSSSVSEFRTFGRQVQQTVKELLTENAEEATSAMRESASRFEKTMVRTASNLDDALDKFASNAETLSSTSQRLTGAISSLVDRVTAIEAPADLVATKIEPAISKIGDVVSLLEQMTDNANKRTETTTSLLTSAKMSIEANQETISASASALKGFQQTLEHMKLTTGEVASASRELVNQSEDVSSRYIQLANNMDDALTRTSSIVEGLEKSIEAVSTSQERLLEISKNELAAAVTAVSDNLVAGSQKILLEQEKTSEAVASHREKLEYEARVASAATTELTESISNLASALGNPTRR